MMPAPPDNRKPRKKTAGKDITRIILVGLSFLGIAAALNNSYVQSQLFDIEVLRQQIQAGGLKSALLFIVAGSLVNAVGIPRLWICAAAGSLYGAIDGAAVGLIASLAGSTINFLVGRSMLRGPSKRNLPRRLQHWYTAFNDHGFRAILYLRLFPLTNATLTNLMGGASQMRFRDYFAATAIGYLPFTIAFATLGSSAAKQNGWQFAAGLGLFSVVALFHLVRSRKKKKNKVVTEPAEDIQPAN